MSTIINIGLEQQQQIRGADGTLLWRGTEVVAASYIVLSSDAAAFGMAEPAVWDAASGKSFIPRAETTAAGGTASADLPASLVMNVKRSAAGAGDVGLIGVTAEPIKIGGRGLIYGAGSICSCQSTAVAISVGASVGGSATAGQVAAVTKSTTGVVLGQCLKTNTGTPASPGAGTGSTGFIGLLVNPS